MSWITTDVRCPDGHYTISETYRRSAGPPPCPTCGKPQTMFYATRGMAGAASQPFSDPTVGVFRPVDFGGKTYHDAESWNRAVDSYCKAQGLTRDQISIEPRASKAQRSALRDELRHEAIVQRRRSGYSEADYREYVREQRARKAERLQRNR